MALVQLHHSKYNLKERETDSRNPRDENRPGENHPRENHQEKIPKRKSPREKPAGKASLQMTPGH